MHDGLEHNPKVSRRALASHHRAAHAWALSLSRYDPATADDVMTLTDLIREQARKLRGFDLEYGIDIWKDETNEADPQ